MSDDVYDEVFPHEHVWTATNRRTGQSWSGTTRYRFVEILAPEGWKTYPGQQCHDDKDGLILADDEARWWEQDLWGARSEKYCLDIGCYGTKELYIFDAHAPNWQGEKLERQRFTRAEDVAAWAAKWMADPEGAVERIRAS